MDKDNISPHMELNPNGDANRPNGGCGCGGHDHDHDHDHDHVDNGGCKDHECHGHDGCGEGSWGLNEYPLAMVYAPCQSFRGLYDPATALHRGTLFTELDLPLGCERGTFTVSGRCGCRAERRTI